MLPVSIHTLFCIPFMFERRLLITRRSSSHSLFAPQASYSILLTRYDQTHCMKLLGRYAC
jgi:hypothetical protein